MEGDAPKAGLEAAEEYVTAKEQEDAAAAEQMRQEGATGGVAAP